MRIESCRKCGNELIPNDKCNVCKKAITFCCQACHFETDEQIHLNCKLIDKEFRLLDIPAA